MIVCFKSLSGKQLQIEIDENIPLSNCVEVITQHFGFPVRNLKMVYSGQMVGLDKSLKDIGYNPEKFIIVHLNADRSEEPTAPQEAHENLPNRPVSPPVVPQEAPPENRSERMPPTPNRFMRRNSSERMAPLLSRQPQINSLPDSERFEENVQSIISIGYERELAERALFASFNNLERAVNFIIEGNIPQMNTPVSRSNRRVPPPPANPVRGMRYIPSTLYPPPRTSKCDIYPVKLFISAEDKNKIDANVSSMSLLHKFSVQRPNETHQSLLNWFHDNHPTVFERAVANPAVFYSFLGVFATQDREVTRLQPAEAIPIGQFPLSDEFYSNEDQAAISRLVQSGFPEDYAISIYEVAGRNEAEAQTILRRTRPQ